MFEQNEISSSLFELLNGLDLEGKQHVAMMLLTVTEDHWPHSAMVSVGEVVALDRKKLRLALWPGTQTTGNMIRSGQATLVAIHDNAAHYVRLKLSRLPELPMPFIRGSVLRLRCFRLGWIPPSTRRLNRA